jgi:SPP1 gp7 family putative phage head morphogenesis protein
MRVFAIHANSPIVPRSVTNPVGGADRVRRAAGAVIDRLNVIEGWLIDRFEQIPVERFLVNALYVNEYRYEYQISVTQLEMLVNEMLAELGLLPNDYVVREVVGAYEQGTGLAVENLANISDDYTRTITQVLVSDPWQRRAALVGSRVFEEMKGFEGDTGRDLARVLRQAVQDGLNPRDVVGTIKDRFGVAESRAKRIATTEISGALRRGRWDEAQDAESRLGIRVRMLWVSALRPTTRLWHASRHGLLYTIQEVREFYAVNGNQINCGCTQIETLVDKDGKPVVTRAIDRLLKQKKEYFGND